MAWFLMYESLGHGDEDWKVQLHTITKTIALTAKSREDAVREARDHWSDLCRGNPFPRLSHPKLRHDESLLMTMEHLTIDELRPAVFRHGDDNPDYTVPWQDEIQRVRVLAHLVVCEICRGQIERERERNPIYQTVCVNREMTWDEVAAIAI